MNEYKYKFSIITAVYNLEDYIEDSINSVINQTIGFENVQLILVNDGSEDNSESICLKFKEMYPDNIVYIAKENGGVSSARNLGINYIEGKYVSFLDGDDKYGSNVLEKVYDFMEENYDKVDCSSIAMKYFEGSNAKHTLNYKYNSTKIVDIEKDYNYSQLSSSSSFIKAEALKKRRFNEKMRYLEDALLMTDIIMEKMAYGVVSGTTYFCRKREDNSSATQSSSKKLEWFSHTIKNFHLNVLNTYNKKLGYIPYYIQYLVMYDIQWRLITPIAEDEQITSKVIAEYRKNIAKALSLISDKIILEQKNISGEYKIYCLSLKYNNNIFNYVHYRDGMFLFQNHRVPIYSFLNAPIITIDVLNIKNECMHLYGVINCPLPAKDYKLYAEVNGEKINIKGKEFESLYKCALNEKIYSKKKFDIELKLKDNEIISFYIQYGNNEPVKIKLRYNMMSKLSENRRLHYVKDGFIIYRKTRDIICKKYTFKNNFILELKNIKDLIKNRKFKQIIFRLSYYALKIFKKKKIWIISDRKTVANDNGMHLFKYINSIKDKSIDVYFALDKGCPDYKEMKKYGKVINYNSIKYKLYFLLSDKLISSQADDFILNAFGKSNQYYRDLYGFDFVFLQHGVTKDDISDWLNLYNKNIKMFVTVGKAEYESILNGNYYYDKSVVKLTGFPRFDNLVNDSKKTIAIMPTWRKELACTIDKNTGIRGYSEEFKESEYFQFYNNLINDKKLLNTMKKQGYKGIFLVHPSHVENSKDFEGNDVFKVIDGFADYQEIFKISDLLVTDYSSVPFDFAYLYKPVIYAQFDRKNFFESHTYKEGYFDYERDGFGPVVYDYDSTVKQIIDCIMSGCIESNTYKQRVDKFYTYHDTNNCKRVYDEIKKIT